VIVSAEYLAYPVVCAKQARVVVVSSALRHSKKGSQGSLMDLRKSIHR